MTEVPAAAENSPSQGTTEVDPGTQDTQPKQDLEDMEGDDYPTDDEDGLDQDAHKQEEYDTQWLTAALDELYSNLNPIHLLKWVKRWEEMQQQMEKDNSGLRAEMREIKEPNSKGR